MLNSNSTSSPLPSSLLERRINAARESGGTSQDHLYAMAIDWLKLKDPQSTAGHVIDYGAGTGSLSTWLIQNTSPTCRITACDIMTRNESLPKKIDWIEQDLNLPLPLDLGETAELLFSIETIEHLENPRFQFREWFRLLRPGGSAFISTPNPESWLSLAYLFLKGVPSSLSAASYPAHLHALTAIELSRIATEAGFTIVEITYSKTGRIPFCRTRTWQNTAPFSLFCKVAPLLGGKKRWSDTTIITIRKPI